MAAETVSPGPQRATILAAAAGGIVVAGTLALWAHYGTTVFFEMVRSGWAACF